MEFQRVSEKIFSSILRHALQGLVVLVIALCRRSRYTVYDVRGKEEAANGEI